MVVVVVVVLQLYTTKSEEELRFILNNLRIVPLQTKLLWLNGY